MKKVLFIMMLSIMFGQTTKSVSYEESIKIEIIARKHAKEDIKIFINNKYYIPESRISAFKQNYNQELYYIYQNTYLKEIESIKKGPNIIKYLMYTAGGCSIYMLLMALFHPYGILNWV